MKYLLAILVTFTLNTHPAIATQNAGDSLTISGRFIWEDPSITGYPSNVKISSVTNSKAELILSVDSLGRFKHTLAYGKYTLSPELNYHWIGEKFIRIDNTSSLIKVDIKADSETELTIRLSTIPWPATPKKIGILTTSETIDPKAIDTFMEERMSFFEIPGASLSLIKDNRIVYNQTYGVANSNTGIPVTEQTLFEAGSITKLVFAFAVMRFYERGQIDLDKPLYKYLEHHEINDERYKLITARHVLSHQTGISNWPKKDTNGKFALNFTPGTQYGYSGKAFEYLKEVLETISSKSIDTILQEEVLEPLEITDMHFKGNDVIAEYGAHGHKRYIPSDIFMAQRTMVAYTLQSTSEALARFAIALHQRKGLEEETYDEFFSIHSERSDGTKWGLGARIEETSSGISYGHSGSTGRGFISNLVIYDNSGLGYVVLTNSQMGGWLSLPLLNEYLILGKSEFENKE